MAVSIVYQLAILCGLCMISRGRFLLGKNDCDVAEDCPVQPSVCIESKCYQTCVDGEDRECKYRYVCNWENLCKPRWCQVCIDGPTYPTSEPVNDIIGYIFANQASPVIVSELQSTSSLIKMAIFIIVGLCIIVVCRKVCNQENKGYETINEPTSSTNTVV